MRKCMVFLLHVLCSPSTQRLLKAGFAGDIVCVSGAGGLIRGMSSKSTLTASEEDLAEDAGLDVPYRCFPAEAAKALPPLPQIGAGAGLAVSADATPAVVSVDASGPRFRMHLPFWQQTQCLPITRRALRTLSRLWWGSRAKFRRLWLTH